MTKKTKSSKQGRVEVGNVKIPVQLTVFVPVNITCMLDDDHEIDEDSNCYIVDITKLENPEDTAKQLLEAAMESEELQDVSYLMGHLLNMHRKKYSDTKAKLSLIAGITESIDV